MEEVVEQVKSRNQEVLAVGETRAVMTVGGARSRSRQAGTQRAARTMSYGRIDGDRSLGEDLAVDTRGTMDGDGADGRGDLGADEETARPGDTDGPGGQGRAAVTTV